MTSDRTLLGALAALALVFLLSLLLYFVLPGNLVRTVLQFPAEISHQLVPEARSLPFNGNVEHDMELLTKEILLGPAQHQHLRLFSREAQVRTVLVRGQTAFIDLSKRAFNPDPDVIYSPVMALDVLKATLMDNFSGVSNVMISVGGEPTGVNLVDKG